MKMRKFKKGFTLVELVVVIAVIAVLAAVSVGAYFGVTDSANSSAAEQYKKQIKDLWIMFSVSSNYQNGSTDEILTANAEYFCTTYARENGPSQVSLNYKLVNLVEIDESVSNQQSSIITTTGIMFLLKSDYSTYLVVENDKIAYESDLLKSEDNFKRMMKEDGKVDYLSTDDKDLFYTLGYSAFELSNFGDSENPVYGYQYYKVNITGDGVNDVVDVRTNSTLAKTKSIYAPAEAKLHDGGVFGKTFKLISKGVEFDSNQLFNTDNSEINVYEEPVLIHEGDNKYYIGEINISYEALLKDLKVNLYNYPICDYDGSEFVFFNDFNSVNSYINQDSIKNDGKNHYLFVGNTTLDSELIIPENYALVLDFNVTVDDQNINTTENTTEMQKFAGYNYFNKYEEIYEMNSTQINNSPSRTNERCYKNEDDHAADYFGDYDTYSNNNFIVSSTGKITLNGKIFNEGYFKHAGHGKNGVKILNKCTITLEEGAVITLNNNSVLRSLGEINGNGIIYANNGSKVYEVFKLSCFMGGSVTSKMQEAKQFPFYDYHLDSIHTKTIFSKGAHLNGFTGIFAELDLKFISQQVHAATVVNIFGSDLDTNYLFRIMNDDSKIIKSYDKVNRKINVEIDGYVSDGNFKFIVSDIEVSALTMNFPITNMNILINSGSHFEISASQGSNYAKYEIYPSTKIYNFGNISVATGCKMIICNLESWTDFKNSINDFIWNAQLADKFDNEMLDNRILYLGDGSNLSGSIYAFKSLENEFETIDDINIVKYKGFTVDTSSADVYTFKIANQRVFGGWLNTLQKVNYYSINAYPISIL